MGFFELMYLLFVSPLVMVGAVSIALFQNTHSFQKKVHVVFEGFEFIYGEGDYFFYHHPDDDGIVYARRDGNSVEWLKVHPENILNFEMEKEKVGDNSISKLNITLAGNPPHPIKITSNNENKIRILKDRLDQITKQAVNNEVKNVGEWKTTRVKAENNDEIAIYFAYTAIAAIALTIGYLWLFPSTGEKDSEKEESSPNHVEILSGKANLKDIMGVAKTTIYFYELQKEDYSKQYIKDIKKGARLLSQQKDGDYKTVFVYFLKKGHKVPEFDGYVTDLDDMGDMDDLLKENKRESSDEYITDLDTILDGLENSKKTTKWDFVLLNNFEDEIFWDDCRTSDNPRCKGNLSDKPE